MDHKLVNFIFLRTFASEIKKKGIMEKAFVYGMSVEGNNFIRLLCKGIHSGFTAQNITEDLPLGSKSNIDRIKKSLIDKEIIYIEKQDVFLADCVFELWFKKEMM